MSLEYWAFTPITTLLTNRLFICNRLGLVWNEMSVLPLAVAHHAAITQQPHCLSLNLVHNLTLMLVEATVLSGEGLPREWEKGRTGRRNRETEAEREREKERRGCRVHVEVDKRRAPQWDASFKGLSQLHIQQPDADSCFLTSTFQEQAENTIDYIGM
jgi:hypothetical protein